MFGLRYLENVATLQLDADACVGCGKCVEVCPHAVFALDTTAVRISDRGACMECGACARNCPVQALTVEAGVGCAAGIVIGAIRGTEPTCDCGQEETNCC